MPSTSLHHTPHRRLPGSVFRTSWPALSLLSLIGLIGFSAATAAAEEAESPTTSIQFNTVTYDSTELTLDAWSEPVGMEEVGILGSSRMGRLFMDEFLPPLFQRTLVLEEPVERGKTITWVFTGPRAGLTVVVHHNRVELMANYYDSWALHPEPVLAGNGEAGRFPEKAMELFNGSVNGSIQSVSLLLHDEMEVELMINGTSMSRWIYLEDISRHQLQVAGDYEPKYKMLRPLEENVQVTVDPSQRHQTILGWGGITSKPAFHMLSDQAKEDWWDFLYEYGFNIQREYPAGRTLKEDMSNLGSLDAAVHHYYGDNFPNGETTCFDYLKRHRELPGSQIWYEYWWHQPKWTHGDAEVYAESILYYCKKVDEVTGRPPEIVGVQNEHRMPNWREQAPTLRRHLDAAGYEAVKIHMNDDSKITDDALTWLREYIDAPEAWAAIDYSATHQYDFRDFHRNPDGYDAILQEWRDLSGDKPFLSTELCANGSDWQVKSYRLAFIMAQQYHKTLTIADAVSVVYCWLLLDVEQPTFNWTRSLMGVDKENGFTAAPTSHQLRTYAAYSRRVPMGMTRIEVDSGHPDLLVSAFEDGKGGATVVLLNRATKPLLAEISGLRSELTTVERTSAALPNLLDKATDPTKPILVDPGEIVTLTNVALGLAALEK